MFCYNARMTIKKKSFAKGVPRRRKVILALNLSGAAGRSMLAGVSRYLSEGHLWRLEIFQLPDAPTADSLRQLEREGFDGYIVTDFPLHDRRHVNRYAHAYLFSSLSETWLLRFQPNSLDPLPCS